MKLWLSILWSVLLIVAGQDFTNVNIEPDYDENGLETIFNTRLVYLVILILGVSEKYNVFFLLNESLIWFFNFC